jgi:hypothetical protein
VASRAPYLYYDVETGRGLSGAPIFSGGELLGIHRGDSKVLPPERALASRHGSESRSSGQPSQAEVEPYVYSLESIDCRLAVRVQERRSCHL